eukprot:COSAG01_NODE_228_length_21104_cov_210.303832_3_plen_86_part_00
MAGGRLPLCATSSRPGLLHHQDGRSRRRRAAAPKLERLDPRQRKGFVIVARVGGQAAPTCIPAVLRISWMADSDSLKLLDLARLY